MDGFVYAQSSFGGLEALNGLLVPTVLIIAIMYFLMIRPQQKRMKEHREMIEGVKKGDVLVTSGGLIGKVTKTDDSELQIEVADGVRVKVMRAMVSEVRGKGKGASPAPAKAEKAEAKAEE